MIRRLFLLQVLALALFGWLAPGLAQQAGRVGVTRSEPCDHHHSDRDAGLYR